MRLTVNDEDYQVRVEPRKSLADALREDCHLTGTHLGCEHGVCGACTVLIDGQPTRSCLVLAVQVDGSEVKYQAPNEAGDGSFWIVAHDNRGGATWIEVPVHVH